MKRQKTYVLFEFIDNLKKVNKNGTHYLMYIIMKTKEINNLNTYQKISKKNIQKLLKKALYGIKIPSSVLLFSKERSIMIYFIENNQNNK